MRSSANFDISLDTVTALVRNLLHLGNTRNISGELILQGDVVWLRLRKDGQEIYTGATAGFDPSKLDRLLDAAAPSIIQEIRPYLIASATYMDDPDRALELAEGIVARLPSSDINVQWSFVLQGKYYLDRHQADLAENCLRKAININSKNAAAYYSLAIALEQQSKVPDAVAAYRRTIDLEPNSVHAHNNLGRLLQNRGEIDAALAEYRLAVAWGPRYAISHNNLGSALKEKGRVQEAVTQYRRAIEIDRTYALARYNLGVVLKELGKGDEAIDEFRKAIEHSPNDVRAHIGLARTLLDFKKVDDALKEYELVIALDPSNATARRDIETLRAYTVDEKSRQKD
jgi:tetratricopeptide (TPR) repeat protein